MLKRFIPIATIAVVGFIAAGCGDFFNPFGPTHHGRGGGGKDTVVYPPNDTVWNGGGGDTVRVDTTWTDPGNGGGDTVITYPGDTVITHHRDSTSTDPGRGGHGGGNGGGPTDTLLNGRHGK